MEGQSRTAVGEPSETLSLSAILKDDFVIVRKSDLEKNADELAAQRAKMHDYLSMQIKFKEMVVKLRDAEEVARRSATSLPATMQIQSLKNSLEKANAQIQQFRKDEKQFCAREKELMTTKSLLELEREKANAATIQRDKLTGKLKEVEDRAISLDWELNLERANFAKEKATIETEKTKAEAEKVKVEGEMAMLKETNEKIKEEKNAENAELRAKLKKLEQELENRELDRLLIADTTEKLRAMRAQNKEMEEELTRQFLQKKAPKKRKR